ncbi:MAG: tetratricopeptide repeat protein [Flavobacteriales bacterium]|nr:tetratricopeptide repeat protein [Flavobacteriales bacterium]
MLAMNALKFQDAYDHLKRALNIKELNHGPENIEVAPVLSNLSMASSELGRLSEAKEFAERSWKIVDATFRSPHLERGTGLNNLAGMYSRIGQKERSLQTFHLAEAELMAVLPPGHELLSRVRYNIDNFQ